MSKSYKRLLPSTFLPPLQHITHLSLAQVLEDFIWAAPEHVLFAEHDGCHHSILIGHETLLEVERFVVPRDDTSAQLKLFPYTQSPSVADGSCTHYHGPTQGPRGLQDTVAGVQGNPGEVALAQVACVVHVTQVDIVEEDVASDSLLCCDVKHR